MGMNKLAASTLLATLLLATTAQAAVKEILVFAAAPSDTPVAANDYKPLIDLLAKESGKKVVMQGVASVTEYTKNMRAATYDFLFDGAYLAAWRMAKQGHVALARLPGNFRILVITRDDGPKSLDEIASGRRVCAPPAPHMLNLALQQQFANPTHQPILVPVQNEKDLVACLRDKRADATVVTSTTWDAMDRSGVRVVATLPLTYPAMTLTVTGELDPALRAKITAALLSDEGTKALAPLLKHYKAERLAPADPKEYEPVSGLLQQVWGFH